MKIDIADSATPIFPFVNRGNLFEVGTFDGKLRLVFNGETIGIPGDTIEDVLDDWDTEISKIEPISPISIRHTFTENAPPIDIERPKGGRLRKRKRKRRAAIYN